MAGIVRSGAYRGRGQVQWSDLEGAAVLAAADGTTVGLRDAAMFRVGSDALLRTSELAAVQVADLAAEADGSGRLTVRRSRTDQEGCGAVL